MNQQELAVVGTMLDDPTAWHYSLGIGSSAGIRAGTIYPVLASLEKSGWLESRWDQAELTRPRRRLYRLTGAGQRGATEALAERKVDDLSLGRRQYRRPGFGLTQPTAGVG